MKPGTCCGSTFTKPVLLVLFTGVLAGCAGLPPYRDNFPANLNIKASLSSPSVLYTAPLTGNFKAELHVNAVDRRCQKNYRGSVKLDDAPASIGIPADQPSYLVFEFTGRSYSIRQANASSTYATLLTPRGGYQYDVAVTYADEMYSITVHERNPRGGARREVERRPFSACKPN